MNATDVLNKRNRDTKASTYRDIDAGHWTNIDYMTVFIQKSNGSGGGGGGEGMKRFWSAVTGAIWLHPSRFWRAEIQL